MNGENVNIASCGDIVLVVSNSEKTSRFRVFSNQLRLSSTVFDALLGPNFAEGQSSLNGREYAREIELKGDDPESMKLVLLVLHLQHKELPQKLNGTLLLTVTNIVDKYLLQESMSLILDVWLRPEKDDQLHDYLQASLILDSAKSFSKVTRLILLHQKTSYATALCRGRGEEFLDVICSIEDQRRKIREEIYDAIEKSLDTGELGICDWNAQVIYYAMEELAIRGSSGARVQSNALHKTFETLDSFKYTGPSGNPTDADMCGEFCSDHLVASEMTETLQEKITLCRERAQGLCLDCMRRGTQRVQKEDCQVQHD